MLLPWYSKTSTFVEHNAANPRSSSLSAFQAFSFVEAAVLLVSAGVLAMLFARAEGRDFKLPGRRRHDRDGRRRLGGAADLLPRCSTSPGCRQPALHPTVGVEWGIFIALLVALGLLPTRARACARPNAPRERPSVAAARRRGPTPRRARRARVASGRAVSRRRPPARPQRRPRRAPARSRRARSPSSVRRPSEERSQPPARGARPTRPRYPPAPAGRVLELSAARGRAASRGDGARRLSLR